MGLWILKVDYNMALDPAKTLLLKDIALQKPHQAGIPIENPCYVKLVLDMVT